jgi:predicted lipid-binding transport protein (Tim44 family)
MTTYSIDYTLTPQLLATYRRHGVKRLRVEASNRSIWNSAVANAVIGIGLGAIIGGIGGFVIALLGESDFALMTGIAGFATGVAFMLLIGYRQMRALRAVMERPSGPNLEPQHAEIDETGLRFSSPSAQSTVQWRAFYDLSETKESIILWMEPAQGISLPLRAFQSDDKAKDFATFAREQIAKANPNTAGPNKAT